MSSAYTVFVPPAPGTPKGLDVRIVVMHRDGRDLTRAELEALYVAYPPPAKDQAAVRKNIEATAEAPTKSARASTKAAKPSKRGGAGKVSSPALKVPKRAAAKRLVAKKTAKRTG